MPKVYFIGAGPGDPELITLKGKKYLEEADCVIYAGSLINPAVLKFAPPSAVKIDSSLLSLEVIIDLIVSKVRKGEKVVRLHSGDPSVFGAIAEQIRALAQFEVEVEIVPGVSSVFAAASRLRREYTLPGVTQTLIITRHEGRTSVPPLESLICLAQHRTSMAILLSATLAPLVEEDLLTSYPPDTPCAVVYHATWPDEIIVEGKLKDLSKMVADCNVQKSTIILVGDFLKGRGERSYLYSGDRK